MEIAQNSTNSFSESLQVFDERLKGGVASKLETARAEAALATVAATIPSLERDILLKENQINVLLGRNPGPIARSSSLLKQTTPPDVPAGLPSALLERRPDVREAEQRVRSANAQVGAAVANFFPQVNLTGLGGKISSDLSKLGTGQAGVWAGEAQITGPLFQGGRMYGVYRQTQAAWEEAALSYKQSALTAFREVADALIARDKLEGIQRQQARSVEAYREAVKVSLQRYQAGRAAYYEVLEAQQQLFPAENALAQTQLDQLLAVVQLYKVLGGGWSPNDDNDHSQ
jgi:multidrug efflux system outer membrane protein